jgi:pyruvate-formate lyase
MTDRIERMRKYIREKHHHQYRQDSEILAAEAKEFTSSLEKSNFADSIRAVRRLKWVLEREIPVFLPEERISFLRTVTVVPEIFTEREWDRIKEQHYIHELGKVCNVTPDYSSVISVGLEATKNRIMERMDQSNPEEEQTLQSYADSIDAVLKLVEKYAEAAKQEGLNEIAILLEQVPRYGATSFHEGLQSFRILHYTLWCSYNYHNTIGRFDQYFYPYYRADIDTGRLDRSQALELLEEFFLSFNRDSDLYPGMQQGDNGQSLVLGGVNEEGEDGYNELSELCLEASLALKLIDPKINLRVHRDTPLTVYESATRLTRQGLGFPQYANDDIVIPGLISKGYSPEDARNYSVAACWEFIIPGKGMDVPNIGALPYLSVVHDVVEKHLRNSQNYTDLEHRVKQSIHKRVTEECSRFRNLYMEPAPFLSIMMDGCIKDARDISKGGIYNNYGLHGTGLSNAVDSLSAIKFAVFRDHVATGEELLKALESDFVGHEKLQSHLKISIPKMGDDNDEVDQIACELMDTFADALQGQINDRGGVYRGGTGSAMYYVLHAREQAATADGRRAGDYLSANYAPSLNTRTKGPVSLILSFTKPDLKRLINGGPFTIELHETVFRGVEELKKVGRLVQSFMQRGGHQFQINTVNRERLCDAQRRPEMYPDLIVRVWGWSGYFVELDKVYQDHIIQREEFLV